MHNRVRIIVASFLVKDLHIDWGRGARWFMQHLVDGDLASNSHDWQWVAGSGNDPSPFFRVFNPVRSGIGSTPMATTSGDGSRARGLSRRRSTRAVEASAGRRGVPGTDRRPPTRAAGGAVQVRRAVVAGRNSITQTIRYATASGERGRPLKLVDLRVDDSPRIPVLRPRFQGQE